MPLSKDERFHVTDPECIRMLMALVPAHLSPRAKFRRRCELVNQGMRFSLGAEGDMSVKQAAMFLGVSRGSIINYIHAGKLPGFYYLSAKYIRIPYADVLTLQDKGRVITTDDAGNRLKPRKGADFTAAPEDAPAKKRRAKKPKPPRPSRPPHPPRRKNLTRYRMENPGWSGAPTLAMLPDSPVDSGQANGVTQAPVIDPGAPALPLALPLPSAETSSDGPPIP